MLEVILKETRLMGNPAGHTLEGSPYFILRKHVIEHEIHFLSVKMQKDFTCSDHFNYTGVQSTAYFSVYYIITHICNCPLMSKNPKTWVNASIILSNRRTSIQERHKREESHLKK